MAPEEVLRLTSPPIPALPVAVISLLVMLPLLAVRVISPPLLPDEELTPVKMVSRSGINSGGKSIMVSRLGMELAPKAVSILPLSLLIDIVPPSPALKEPE